MRLIDADALKNKIEQHSYPLSDRINSIENGMFLCGIYQAVDESPTADVVPVVHGRWLINSDGYYPYCSECKEEPKSGIMTHYCPNCGAKMDKEDET
jgi:ligand-binding sensor protein